MWLQVKAQGARARADTAVTKAESLRDAVDAAAAKADNARDAHFELWRNTIAQGVEARNHEVALLTNDDELRRPCDEVDASRMQGSTLDLVRAVSLVRRHAGSAPLRRVPCFSLTSCGRVTQSKLGPWAMPVDHMGTIEVLVNQYRTRKAGPGVGSPAQGSPTQAADGAAPTTAKAGLQRGRINVLKEEFGFIRPEDMSGDRDIYFRVSDIVGSARAGDEVTYDTVRDERGSTDKDLRAVNICRMDIEPYASYDDLDTMPWQDTNAALLWCTESLARPPSEPGSARGATPPAPGTPQSYAKGARSDATGAGRGKRKGRKGRSRARRPRTGGLDISPVNTNRKRAGRRPKSTLPAALATRGGGDGGAAGGARPTTPGGSVMPLPKLAQQPRDGAAGGDGALPAWRSGATGRPPRRRKPKASHGPSGELAPILRRGQMLA